MKGGDSDSDSDDDKKRVVRSHRDKKWDQMIEAVNELNGHVRSNDWVRRGHATGCSPRLALHGEYMSLRHHLMARFPLMPTILLVEAGIHPNCIR